MLELVNLQVAPVVAERNSAGKIINMTTGSPSAVYTLEDVIAFFQTVESQLEKHNADLAEVEAVPEEV